MYLFSSIILSFSIQFFIYYGIGIVIKKIIKENKTDIFATLVLGLFGLIFILLIEHFFMPISGPALLIPIITSIVGFTFLYGKYKQILQQIIASVIPISFNVFLIGCLIYLNDDTQIHYDTGLYHAQKVLWYNEQPIWPGIGLLSSFLGYNMSFFLPVAFFRQISLSPEILHYSVSSFWVINFATYLILQMKKYHSVLQSFIFILFLTIFTYPLITMGLWGFSPDPVITVLTLWIYIKIFAHTPNHKIKQPMILLITMTTIVSIKLSGAIMLLPALVFVLNRRSFQSFKILSAKGILLTIGFIFIWAIHGYLESGYFSFPAGITFGSPEWKISNTHRIELVTILKQYAMTGSSDLTTTSFNLQWVLIWLQSPTNLLITALLLLSLISCIILFFLYRKNLNYEIILYIFLWISVIIWFTTVPARRFAFAAIITTILFPVWIIIKTHNYTFKSQPPMYVALCSVVLYQSFVFRFWDTSPKLHEIPIVETKKTIINELTIHSPVNGDQCWSTETPCTPYQPTNLEQTEYKIGPLHLKGYRLKK